MEDAEQAVLIANLNLTAGLKAMEMSDFSGTLDGLRTGNYLFVLGIFMITGRAFVLVFNISGVTLFYDL